MGGNASNGVAMLGSVLLLHVLIISVGLAAERSLHFGQSTGRVPKQRHTLQELRDQHVVKQQLDYSCGTAALATLMRYYFGDETSEHELLAILTAGLTRDELAHKQKTGFSLLDLKRVVETKGYQAAGFILTIEQLKQLAAPVIVFVQPRHYKHFAVLRGIDRGRVFLADPARGNLRMSIGLFVSEWNGVVFILDKPGAGNVTTYPLALPRSDYVQPELLRVGRLSGLETFPLHFGVPSRVR